MRGGAPYSAEKSSPWNRYWKQQADQQGYRYSPQEHVVLFEADGEGFAMRVVNSLGEESTSKKTCGAVPRPLQATGDWLIRQGRH